MHSESWAIQSNYMGYQAGKFITRAKDGLLWMELRKLAALSYVFRFDAIFFNFGSTLFSPRAALPESRKTLAGSFLFPIWRTYTTLMQKIELWLLRKLRRKLFIQYQGDDARQGDHSAANFSINLATQVRPGYYTAESDALKRRQIALLTRHCCRTYALNPDLLHVLPADAEFLPYCHIHLDEWTPVYTQSIDKPLRIGHAPSHRRVKGTEHIIKALDRLSLNHEFELVLIEGKSHAETKRLLGNIDVLVDQLFAGWYGGVAVEAMALGKPVVSYIREGDLRFVPQQMREELPVVSASPDTIDRILEQMLTMSRDKLLELAHKSRSFVERWHDDRAIAQRIKTDIETALLR